MYIDIHDETTIKVDIELDMEKKEIVLCVLEISEPLTPLTLIEALNELTNIKALQNFRIVKIKQHKVL